MNPYLQRLRDRYEGLRSGIEGLQTRAANEDRDLTEDELRSINEQAEQAKTLATQIQDLTEVETRNHQVAELSAQIADSVNQAAEPQAQTRATSSTQAVDREPGHYTRGGHNSFFRDLVRARDDHDEDAARRLVEHNRALSTGTEGAGVVPPKWLVEEYEEQARQGRAIANAVRNIPLGDDPRPMTLPKQTGGTDDNVEEQSSENESVNDDDNWASDVDNVTPRPTAGAQIVSRQMLDMASPAIDQLLYGDLISSYNLKIERKVGDAIMDVGSALTADSSLGPTDVDDENHFVNVALDALIEVRSNRKLPANSLVTSVARYGEFLKLKDSTGRPLVPADSGGAMNVVGVGTVAVDGRVHGVGIIATDGIDTDSEFAAVRTPDVLLFEGNMLRFRYDQPEGPQSVKLGIWAYTAVIVRQGDRAVKRVSVEAAS